MELSICGIKGNELSLSVSPLKLHHLVLYVVFEGEKQREPREAKSSLGEFNVLHFIHVFDRR